MKLENLTETPVVYLRQIGPYGASNNALMDRFKRWVGQQDQYPVGPILGIAQDDPQITPPWVCRYDVCLPVAQIRSVTPPFQAGTLTGGWFAVYRMPHTAAAVAAFYRQLPQLTADLIRRPGPLIERYVPECVAVGECDVLVPVVGPTL